MRPLRLLLLSAIAFAPVPQAHAQAYDPMAQAYTPYDPMASGPQAPAAPQTPGRLSDVGRQAQQAAEESRRQAAENLDRGIRGEIEASEVRGLSDSAAALGAGTLTPEQQAKMAAQVNGGMEEVRRMMQQQGQANGYGGSVNCDAPTRATGGILEARARDATHAYVAALQAGDAVGIKDAVARGQLATADMNALTRATGGCTDTGSGTQPGSQVIDVQPGSGAMESASSEQKQAAFEAAAREVLRLKLLLAADPNNEAKQRAFERAERALETFRAENGGELDRVESEALLGRIDDEYRRELVKLYEKFAREQERRFYEHVIDQENEGKYKTSLAAIGRLSDFVEFAKDDIPLQVRNEIDDRLDKEFRGVLKEDFHNISRNVNDLRLELLFDPGNPEKTAALKEAEQRLATFKDHPRIKDDDEEIQATNSEAEYKRATFDALQAEMLKIEALRDDMRNNPESQMKRLAFEGANEKLTRIVTENPDDFDMPRVKEMMKVEQDNYRVKVQNDMHKEMQAMADLRVAARSDPYNEAKQKAYQDAEKLLQAKEKATPEDFDTPQFRQMIETEQASYRSKMSDVLEERTNVAMDLLSKHRADPDNVDLKNDFITARLKAEAFADSNVNDFDPDRAQAALDRIFAAQSSGSFPEPPPPAVPKP